MIIPPLDIIAEAGTNHGGDLQKAKNCGKRRRPAFSQLQIIYPEGLYLRNLGR